MLWAPSSWGHSLLWFEILARQSTFLWESFTEYVSILHGPEMLMLLERHTGSGASVCSWPHAGNLTAPDMQQDHALHPHPPGSAPKHCGAAHGPRVVPHVRPLHHGTCQTTCCL